MSALDGARTSLYCATSAYAPNLGGRYFLPFGKLDTDHLKWIDDAEEVSKLWNLADSQLKASGIWAEEFPES